MKKLYIKGINGEKVYVDMEIEAYAAHHQIAILLYVHDTGEYYGDLSVFVEPFERTNFMAVDTNNIPDAEKFIERYKLGTLKGIVHSGFCSYPVYAMDLEELMKYDNLGVSKFILNK